MYWNICLETYPSLHQLDFDDVIAEPKAAHGFDPIWRLSFILFSQVMAWNMRGYGIGGGGHGEDCVWRVSLPPRGVLKSKSRDRVIFSCAVEERPSINTHRQIPNKVKFLWLEINKIFVRSWMDECQVSKVDSCKLCKLQTLQTKLLI